ncbi:MAG: DUF6473 family protein, partial [Planktomarina sp.]
MHKSAPAGALDGEYQLGRLHFRGRQIQTTRAHITLLGGTETYGRFMPDPYAKGLRRVLDCPVRNLGVINGGLDCLQRVMQLLQPQDRVQSIVLETPGLLMQSNPFYDVHPYRNDRITRLKPLFLNVFPKVDELTLHFVGHLWHQCKTWHPEQAGRLVQMLRDTWLNTMEGILLNCPAPVHLLHFAGNSAGGPRVTLPMIQALKDGLRSTTVIERDQPDFDSFKYDEWDEGLVYAMQGQLVHDSAVAALATKITAQKSPAQQALNGAFKLSA